MLLPCCPAAGTCVLHIFAHAQHIALAFPFPSCAVVYDINGREAEEAEIVLDAVGPGLQQYIFCSSAGVYKKSEQMPHREEDDVDFNSRHKVGPAGGCFGCGRCLGAVGCRGSQHSVVPCVTCDAGVALRAAHAASTAR